MTSAPPIAKQPPFRRGEHVWRGHDVVIVMSDARGTGYQAMIDVKRRDGFIEEARATDLHRWSRQMMDKEDALRKLGTARDLLLRACEQAGCKFGSQACRALPQWAPYQAADKRFHAAWAAARAVHPYWS